jgi:hypothetical protein
MRQCDIATTRRLACRARDRTTARQRAVWRFVVLSLAPTQRTKAYQISYHTFVLHIVANVSSTKHQAKRRVVGLSSCRPVANDASQMTRCRVAYRRDVTLSLGSNRRIADIATARRKTTRRLACFAIDRRTTNQQCDNAPFGAFR